MRFLVSPMNLYVEIFFLKQFIFLSKNKLPSPTGALLQFCYRFYNKNIAPRDMLLYKQPSMQPNFNWQTPEQILRDVFLERKNKNKLLQPLSEFFK